MAETKSYNILYVPTQHGVLEFDELTTLTGAGHRVFSLGDHWLRSQPVSNGRDSRQAFFDDEFTAAFLADPGCSRQTKTVSADFCRLFDIIIVSGAEDWLFRNIHGCGDLPVIYRTIGQSNLGSEAELKALSGRVHVVRYAQAEVALPGFAETAAVIYFGKEPADFPRWTGGSGPLTFHSHYGLRASVSIPKPSDYSYLSQGFGASLYGLAGEGIENYKGHLASTEQFPRLSEAGCYIYVWTIPPSYTLSLIEAMLVGVPIVAPSAALVSAARPDPQFGWTPERYEVPMMLAKGRGFLYDDLNAGRSEIFRALTDTGLARNMSERARTWAMAKFGNATIGADWNRLLNQIIG